HDILTSIEHYQLSGNGAPTHMFLLFFCAQFPFSDFFKSSVTSNLTYVDILKLLSFAFSSSFRLISLGKITTSLSDSAMPFSPFS
ncbi:hypothetical protein, partial [Enterococcus faecium]|uniref:hypothetical protein n=1 Tax=Enterococcus faecium TaxID=1352 RepID=UPI001A9326C3